MIIEIIILFLIFLMMLFGFGSILLGFYISLQGLRLRRYLKTRKPEIYKELMKGYLDRNPVEWMKFLVTNYRFVYKSSEIGDRKIKEYKNKLKLLFKLLALFLGLSFLMFGLIFIISLLGVEK